MVLSSYSADGGVTATPGLPPLRLSIEATPSGQLEVQIHNSSDHSCAFYFGKGGQAVEIQLWDSKKREILPLDVRNFISTDGLIEKEDFVILKPGESKKLAESSVSDPDPKTSKRPLHFGNFTFPKDSLETFKPDRYTVRARFESVIDYYDASGGRAKVSSVWLGKLETSPFVWDYHL